MAHIAISDYIFAWVNCCELKFCIISVLSCRVFFAAVRDVSMANSDGNTTVEMNYLMQEVHYCRLEAQSNVYGLAQFKSSTNENRLLVASIHGKVMSVSFQKTVPSSREVHFTYIPGIFGSLCCLLF